MAGTAEREIIGPQTPPCEIQSRQAAILPEPNDVTQRSGEWSADPESAIQELQ